MDVYEARVNNNNITTTITTIANSATDVNPTLVHKPKLSQVKLPETTEIFFKSIARNSNSSKLTYKIGIEHFQRFLLKSYQRLA
jgi:hypothetical protein